MKAPLYQFPPTRFARANTPWRQWWHLLSEVIEVGVSLLKGDLHHAARETWDVKHSAETLHRIMERRRVNVLGAKVEIVKGNLDRGYYE